MKKLFRIFLVLVLLAAVSFAVFPLQAGIKSSLDYNTSVEIDGGTYKVAVADTEQEREKGLGSVANLPSDAGMLFVFDMPDKYGFWMKDTLIPLDMVWLDGDKRVVYIQKNVLPESFPEVYMPSTPALYVLEFNSGFADKHKINIGDLIQFSI